MQFTQLTWDKTIQLIHSPIFHTQVIKRIPSFITKIKNFKKKILKIYMGEFPHYIRRQFLCYANYFTLLQILKLCILYLVFLICFITFQCKYRVYSIYRHGGKNFWVHNTGPLGCLPQQLATTATGDSDFDKHGCLNSLNNAAISFN